MSDTPISDSTPHNIAELGMLCRRLERKLAATRRYLSEVTEKAKRLEAAGDELLTAHHPLTEENWRKAKEAKL